MRPTILVISIQGWSDMWVSKHWIATALTEYGDVYFLEPFKGAFLKGRGGRLREFLFGPSLRREGKVNVLSVTSLPGYYKGTGWYRALSRLMMSRQIANLKHLLGNKSYILTFDGRSLPLIKAVAPDGPVIYYAIDAMNPKNEDPWYTEAALIDASDAVLTTSIRHKNRLLSTSTRRDFIVLPHGVDFSLASDAVPSTRRDTLYDAVIGYTGSIHDEYVDFNIIRQAALARPRWNFVFIGPAYRNPLSVGATDQIKLISDLPNVQMLGAKPYQSLPSYIADFNVCIMPYKLSVDNEPFKTLNYFAQGKPVVSADVVGVSDYKELLYTYRDAEGFISSIERALAEPRALGEARVKYAEDRDFRVLTSKLVDLFAELSGQSGGSRP
ncbi:Glycosyltransferase involved in cell wall bisynthesis [Devosia enhydra]|uniref:Glycosyltransferase involved in cell wall bisynthesis n=1 Tax=Devosia enhydra TaxID=665118 RepID=A0A1K2I0U6_9HYPH|nr:glycosyltransferase [Devosia enhydra]SFZ85944.1 Glycosyltransferase involved in cell wall bisynthesis [Devosia enhydra]